MAIESVKLIEEESSLDVDSEYRRTYKESFLIKTTADGDYPPTILKDSGNSPRPQLVPDLWTYYGEGGEFSGIHTNFDTYSFLQSKTFNRYSSGTGDRRRWKCDCTWKPAPPGGKKPKNSADNPFSWPIKYSLEWANYTRVLEFDIDGKPITNAAGDLFNPPPMVDDARMVLVGIRNVSGFNYAANLAGQYKDKVNSDIFHGYPPRTCKVESITTGNELESGTGVKYYSLTIRVQLRNPYSAFNSPTAGSAIFEERFVNQGRQVLDKPKEQNGKLVRPSQDLDVVMLKADGTEQTDRKIPGILWPLITEPGYYIYEDRPFNELGI
jgi:hypothetical protein